MTRTISDKTLAEALEIAADGIICIDASARITYFNVGAQQIFGWSAEEIVGQHIATLIPERFRQLHARELADFGRSGFTARRVPEWREIFALRKNGEEFPAEAAISQIQQDGEATFALVMRDISVRKRYEQRHQFLAAAGERLASAFGSSETLLEVARLAVPAIAEGCILENRVGEGFRAGAVSHADAKVETTLEEICSVGVRIPSLAHPLTQILQKNSPVLLQSDAGKELLESSGTPAYAEGIRAMNPETALFLPLVAREQLIGALTLFAQRRFDDHDVEFAEDLARLAALALDNARLHDAVRASLRARDEMVGVVSHDLRNPVAAVKRLSRSLLKTDVSGELRDSIALISLAAEQMDALIRDLMDLDRLDAGTLLITPTPCDLQTLLTQSLQTLRPLVDAAGVTLDLRVDPDLPQVMTDPYRVRQILSNLVGNAMKFSDEGASVAVVAHQIGNDVAISVVDAGRGIPSDQLPNVFDRYWQSSRTDRDGAGLGLAIAKGLVEALGGRISMESSPGQGTTVTFTLPVVDALAGLSS